MPQYNTPPNKVIPSVTFPNTIPASGNWISLIIPAYRALTLVVGAKLDQTGTLKIQRYADAAGTVPVGGLLSQAMTSNVAAWTGAADGVPFSSFQIEIDNGTGTIANLSETAVLATS